MRKIFIDELILAAKKNKNIILVVNDLGYNVVESFAKKFPKQFYNVGVAEQNMMGIAAFQLKVIMYLYILSEIFQLLDVLNR